jgi:virginiamycin B lyase
MSCCAATRKVALTAVATLIGLVGLSAAGTGASAGTVPAAGRAAANVGAITNYTDSTIAGPFGIAAGPDGALWFTSQTYSSVERISTSGVVANHPSPSGSITWGITAGSDGALWYTNLGNNVIGRVTPSGALSYFTGPSVIGPLGIAAGPDGALWFANNGNNTIGRITTAGVATSFSDPTISGPDAITAGPDGALWFTNLNDNSIGRITTAGVVRSYSSPTISGPVAITVGPDGALWFTNGGNNSIGRITTSGVVTNYTSPTISDPEGITAGPDGALWFTNFGNNSIGRITAGPALTPQAIAFTSTPPSGAMVGDPPDTVSATGGASGNAVVFSVEAAASSVCSIAGAVVSLIGPGRCTIDANQAGTATYSAAPQVQQKFIVGEPSPVITSANDATGSRGSSLSFVVTTMSASAPTITKKGKLPKHITFVNNGDGTATISGTPATTGTYQFTIRARLGKGKKASVATQLFTLTIGSD